MGKGEAQRNAAERELGLRTYTLEGTLADVISNSVKLGASTLFMEIRNYSSNFKTSPVIYIRVILVTN